MVSIQPDQKKDRSDENAMHSGFVRRISETIKLEDHTPIAAVQQLIDEADDNS